MVARRIQAKRVLAFVANHARPSARPNPRIFRSHLFLTGLGYYRSVKRLSLGILAILGCPCFAAPAATPPAPQFKPEIDQAFSQLYSSNFTAAQTTLDHYIAEHPNDSVAYSVKGAGYLFSELER